MSQPQQSHLIVPNGQANRPGGVPGAQSAMAMPHVSAAAPLPAQDWDPLYHALLESRQRWRNLVSLAVDIAFETDAAGSITFIHPENALGYPASTLIGMPATMLLADHSNAALFNPFQSDQSIHRRRVWVRNAAGSQFCFSFACQTMIDIHGQIAGTRAVAQDVTAQDEHDTAVSSALRRGEVLDHILWQLRQEVLAPRMMQTVLDALCNALGAEGVVLVDALGTTPETAVLHKSGDDPSEVVIATLETINPSSHAPSCVTTRSGAKLLVCPT